MPISVRGTVVNKQMQGDTMNKLKQITMITAMVMLANCAYNPKIDTAGRSGTFPEAKAVEITNDVQHCQQFADANTFRLYDTLNWGWGQYFHIATLGIVPARELKYKTRVQKCLEGRGHSVVK
tara:strand:- start:874 stop:1242 length:369 start_codon:yes stop_codon:yes gene_type:complete